MDRMRLFVLSNENKSETLRRIVEEKGLPFQPLFSHEDISQVSDHDHNFLLAHNTSVILRPDEISKFPAGAYNIHAASPEYPGRDPHHFAIYHGAHRYGATLHVLEERVDAGPIVEVIEFAVARDDTPYSLLEKANEAALTLVRRVVDLVERGAVGQLENRPRTWDWAGRKYTRKDFLALCEIPSDISEAELQRRIEAFYHPKHNNLFTIVRGRKFYLDLPDG